MGQTAVTPAANMMNSIPIGQSGTSVMGQPTPPMGQPTPPIGQPGTPPMGTPPMGQPTSPVSSTANSVLARTTVADLAKLNQEVDTNAAIDMTSGTNKPGLSIHNIPETMISEGMDRPTVDEIRRSPGLYPQWTTNNMNTVVPNQGRDPLIPNPFTPATVSPTDENPYRVFNVDNMIAQKGSGTIVDDRTGSATQGKMLTISDGIIREAYQIDMNTGQKVNVDTVTGSISGQQFAQTNPNTGEQLWLDTTVPTAGTPLGSNFGVIPGFGQGANNNALSSPPSSMQYPLGAPMTDARMNEVLNMTGGKPPIFDQPNLAAMNTIEEIIMQEKLKNLMQPAPVYTDPWLDMRGVN